MCRGVVSLLSLGSFLCLTSGDCLRAVYVQLDLGAASSVERAEAAYRLFKSLMQSDTDDFAYEYKAPARKGRTPGKTPSKTPGKTPGGKGSAAKRTPGTGASKGGSTAKRKKTKRVDSEDEEEWQGSDDEWGDTAKKLL